MSRVIKFRAWNATYNWMEDCFYIGAHDGVAYDKPSLTFDTPNTEIEEFPDYELMQFTGLTDKNGVEIYEGDIVHWGHIVDYEEYTPRKAVVEFSPDLTFSTFNLESNHKFRFGNFAYRNTEKAVEVIGNIYQNPELLKTT